MSVLTPSPVSPVESVDSTQCVIVAYQQQMAMEEGAYETDLIRRQISIVVRDLEIVVSELNSVMEELNGVLDQIDRVTACLDDDSLCGMKADKSCQTDDHDLRVLSFYSNFHHSDESCENSDVNSTTSNSSAEDSLPWKISPDVNTSDANRGLCDVSISRGQVCPPSKNVVPKRCSEKKVERPESKVKPIKCRKPGVLFSGPIKVEELEPVIVRHRPKRAFLHKFCCVRAHSMYSCDGDLIQSIYNSGEASQIKNSWVLRAGNGVKSPVWDTEENEKSPSSIEWEDRTCSHSSMSTYRKKSSSSSSDRSESSSTSKKKSRNKYSLPGIRKDTKKRKDNSGLSLAKSESYSSQSSNKTSHRGSASHNQAQNLILTSNTFHSDLSFKSDSLEMINVSKMSIFDYEEDLSSAPKFILRELEEQTSNKRTSPKRYFGKSHVFKSGREESHLEEGNTSDSLQKCLKNRIYTYESETDCSQFDHDNDAGMLVDHDGSDLQSPVSVGKILSFIESGAVDTDTEHEFSLMGVVPKTSSTKADKTRFSVGTKYRDQEDQTLKSNLSKKTKRKRIQSLEAKVPKLPILKQTSLFKSRSHPDLRKKLFSFSRLSGSDHNLNKEVKIGELSQKMSFNSSLVSNSYDLGKHVLVSPDEAWDILSLNSPPNSPANLSDVLTLDSTGSNEEQFSAEFEADPEVQQFMKELDEKIKVQQSGLGSLGKLTVSSVGSKESLTLSDNVFVNDTLLTKLDINSNFKNMQKIGSSESALSDDSNRPCPSETEMQSDNLLEGFEWEHSFLFSMYQDTCANVSELNFDSAIQDAQCSLDSGKTFDSEELMRPLTLSRDKKKPGSVSSDSYIWSDGSVTSESPYSGLSKTVDELFSELDISPELLEKNKPLKRPDQLCPSLSDLRHSDSLTRSDGQSSDFKVNYNRDINTWTAFAICHIGGSESNLSKSSAISAEIPTANKSSLEAIHKPNEGFSARNANSLPRKLECWDSRPTLSCCSKTLLSAAEAS